MASLAASIPPNPQTYSQPMASATSPSPLASQQSGPVTYSNAASSVSFDGSQQSLSQNLQPSYSQSFPNGPVSNPIYSRSFTEGSYGSGRGYGQPPQIYTAAYSGVSVYEMEIGGVACMRRRSDGWLNATQILKVAGVEKGKRTKVLEKEILTGEHEKVQGGYGKYQGTWISYHRGREFCRQYGVEDILRPLLDYDISADGTSGQGQDTPTKEQAMAANRKRFYNSNLDPRLQGGSNSNGTFFSNISPTTSVALAAMNKAARLNSPAPRPSSAQRPPSIPQPSQQDSFPGGSQQSIASDAEAKPDSGYSTQPNGEPPRKRMRQDSQDGSDSRNPPLDVSMRSATPTEPNESFLYGAALMQDSVNASGEPIALVPLPNPTTEEQHEKMNLILDLFSEQAQTDYSSHAALTHLSGEDLNMVLDASANNALHWAATLAKVPLLKLLIQKGANIWRGNAAGQSPLISAVLVNNCWEHSCFPELLELLGPLIEVRDLQGRTILHHIAVSSGIKGRGPSSKYYLEALLEFLVRIGTQPSMLGATQGATGVAAAAAAVANLQQASQQTGLGSSSQDSSSQHQGPVSLVRFLSHIVNARDKAGNTALNLVARIGNRSIIQQLLEIHADPHLPNNKGVSAKDFGVGIDTGTQSYVNGGLASQGSVQSLQDSSGADALNHIGGENAAVAAGSQAEDLGQDVIASVTSMLTQNLASHKELLRSKTERIDRLTEEIRDLSARQKVDLDAVQQLKERARLRAERQSKVANLKREIDKKQKEMQSRPMSSRNQTPPAVEPAWLHRAASQNLVAVDPTDTEQRHFLTTQLPPLAVLRAHRSAYVAHNANLRRQAEELQSRSIELERLYRRVVALCTGVAEDRIDENLAALVAAVESEQGSLGEQEVGRVREFLRRVDGVQLQQAQPTAIAAGAPTAE